MSDYLTNRAGYWHFVRRVPSEFAKLDPRGIVKHSTKIPVAEDRRGIRAKKIAEAMNRKLEAYWLGMLDGKAQEAKQHYEEARLRARIFRFDHGEPAGLACRPPIKAQ
jgi:hypothetical protein